MLSRVVRAHVVPEADLVSSWGMGPWAAQALKEIGNADRQEAGRRLNNRAENSHQPFRRRERAMQRFRSMKTLQKFSSFMPRSTTISIRSAISSPARFTNKGAPPRRPSGAPSRPSRRLGLRLLRPTQTTCRCSDKADYRHDPRVVGKMAGHAVLPWELHRVFSLMKRWGLGTYHGLRGVGLDE